MVTVPPSIYTGPINNSINNTPQGDELVRANQAQAAALGIKLPGPTPHEDLLPGTASQITGKAAPPGGTFGNGPSPLAPPTTATPPTTPTTTPSSTGTTNNDDLVKQQLAQAQADYQAESKNVHDTILNIQNGTTPLTPGEQAQIDGLKAQFQDLVNKQAIVNTGASGLANVRGYQTGAAEYDPTFQVKTIGAIVSAGQAKIADLQIKEASAVAALTQSFKEDDIKAVQEAWGIYQKAFDERQTALQKTIDDTAKAIKDAQEQQLKVQQYNLDVAKFNQTQDKDSFDRAFKIEQEKFDEKYKNQTLALEKFKAGLGAGGSGIPGAPSQSAELTASGNPDLISQKQVYDQIAASYGPMTAIAIKNLANYQTNPADWSSRATKGLTHAQAVTLAQMYDPTYDEKMYSTRAAYQKSMASNQAGTIGSAVNAANKSINHLTSYVNTMNEVNKPGIGSAAIGTVVPFLGGFGRLSTTVNTLENKMTLNPTQRANISKATTEGLGVAEELAKFFKGTGATSQTEIDSWREQVSPNSSPAAVRGSTQAAIDLLQGQLEVLTEQYTSTMGKAPETDFLNTSARASLSNLKNQGYKVDIPGVNYTDKDAYIKNDSEAPANLAQAYQILVDANDPNNPPSPENVLELAQMQ